MQKRIIDFLEQHDIPYRVISHPAVFTVAESILHVKDDFPLKNLLLTEEKGTRKILVIMAGQDRLDTKMLARTLQTKKLRFASADMLLDTLGVTPGSVSLFGLLHDGSTGVELVMDDRLPKVAEVGFHPNDNTSTIFIPGAAITRITAETGHTLHIVSLQK